MFSHRGFGLTEDLNLVFDSMCVLFVTLRPNITSTSTVSLQVNYLSMYLYIYIFIALTDHGTCSEALIKVYNNCLHDYFIQPKNGISWVEI